MIKKTLIGVVGLICLFMLYVAFQPSEYKISREIKIKASPEAIFPLINDQRQLERWMPWSELDPEVEMVYSGPEEGVGSKASWTSSGQMGVGSSTIVESVPHQKTKFSLEYKKPFEMSQVAELVISKSDDASTVTWTVEGKNNFLGRLMCVFMDMDEMVGKNFVMGLQALKEIAEVEQ